MYMDAYLVKHWMGDLDHPETQMNLMRYLMLGDPTMPVWVGGIPVAAQVRGAPDSLGVGNNFVAACTVSVAGVDPAGDAIVCFCGPGSYCVARTDGDGQALVRFRCDSAGLYTLTVSEGHAHHWGSGSHTPILPAQRAYYVGNCWAQKASMPRPLSGKPVRHGGWLAYNAGDSLVYAAKGNKSSDFYSYSPSGDTWHALHYILPGTEGKLPAQGCRGVADGDSCIYMVKGNYSRGFWRYHIGSDWWQQLDSVPLGRSGKKVKKGSDLVYVPQDGGYVYLLKGPRCDFCRYSVHYHRWDTLASAPEGPNHKGWNDGSWLVYDGNHTIYAHKARFQELWKFDTDTCAWDPVKKTGIPVGTSHRRSREGGCGAWYNGALYALKGGNRDELWKYYPPPGDSWRIMDPIPAVDGAGEKKYVRDGADLVVVPGRGLYATKGNKCTQFWQHMTSPYGVGDGAFAASPQPGGSGGSDNGETPIMDGLSASSPRWDPVSSSSMVVYSREDTLGDGYEQVYQRFYGSSIPEQRVTEVRTDCEEPVVSPLRPGGQLIAFQFMDTLSDCYEIAVTPAYGSGGGGGSGGTDEVSEEPVASSDATAPASSFAPVGSVSALAATGGSTILSRPIWQRTFGNPEADRLHPEFDQSGTWICYERDVDGPGGCYTQIWRVRADSGAEQQVTFDNADHFSPSFLNPLEILFTLSPNTGYDVVAKVNTLTHQVTVLSNLQTDHDRPNPAWNGAYAVSEALDDAGNTQIVKIPVLLGAESWLTSGTSDIMEPDYSPDNQSVFAVRWTGITSQIVCVNAQNGGYLPVTDSLAIRDNPDVHLSPNSSTSLAVYEREAWNPLDLLLGGGKRKPGSGIFLSKFRRPKDGPQGTSLGVLALERARPNPVRSRVTICWQVPVEADVTLRIYNTAGQLVKVLADGLVKPGAYTSVWNGTDTRDRRLANGVYFYALDNGSKRISRKLVLTD